MFSPSFTQNAKQPPSFPDGYALRSQIVTSINIIRHFSAFHVSSVVIPFDNQISKDTDLYRLYNTNIHEKIAEQKKKEAMLQ